jgi:hypothetical protein
MAERVDSGTGEMAGASSHGGSSSAQVRVAASVAASGAASRRFVCIFAYALELVSNCPNCGEHGTISRLTRTEDMKCQACGHSMLRSI